MDKELAGLAENITKCFQQLIDAEGQNKNDCDLIGAIGEITSPRNGRTYQIQLSFRINEKDFIGENEVVFAHTVTMGE